MSYPDRIFPTEFCSPCLITSSWVVKCGICLCFSLHLLACQVSSEATPYSQPDLSFLPTEIINQNKAPISLVVYPIQNIRVTKQSAWIAPMLTKMIMSDLSHWPHWRIISREAMSSILREQWLQYQSSHSDKQVQLGRLQGARFMLQGGLFEENAHVVVDLQILDVETGVVFDTVRCESRIDEISRLERDLVRVLVERLPQGKQRDHSVWNGERTFSIPPTPLALPPQIVEDISSGDLPRQLIFPEEMKQLSQNYVHQRLRISQAVHNIFERGLRVEFGHSYQSSEFNKGEGNFPVTSLLIPVVLYAEEHRIRDFIGQIFSEKLVTELFESGELGVVPSGPDIDDLRYLGREMSRPRRLYVRARSEQGVVVAVFSRWEWRTDRVVIFTNQMRMTMPWWPTPLFAGLAEFPMNWLDRNEAVLTFDTVFVDLNDEERHVVAEWVSPLQIVEVPDNDKTRERIIRQLETWIQEHWVPSMAEALPVDGYVPGNKQLAHLRLQVKKGVITHLEHHMDSVDPIFIGGIQDLVDQLRGACPWCESGSELSEILQEAEFRVQCMLNKPIQQMGFHSYSSSSS